MNSLKLLIDTTPLPIYGLLCLFLVSGVLFIGGGIVRLLESTKLGELALGAAAFAGVAYLFHLGTDFGMF